MVKKNDKNRSPGISRRDFLHQGLQMTGAAMLGSSLSLTGYDSSRKSSNARRPNVLYIIADQCREQALGCNGDPNAKTPHIDKMASQGIRLTHCYSNEPVCTPYRGILMSGRYPTRTGVYKNNIRLPSKEYCLGEVFRDAGYSTGYIGKWHLDGSAKPGRVRHTQGWQYFSGFNRSHHYYDGHGVYWEDRTKHRIGDGVYQPADQANRAMKWIRKQAKKEQPWFMLLSCGPPHTPYRELPQKYLKMFNPKKLILRKNVHKNKPVDKSELRQMLQGYYAQLKALDDNISRLMQFLRNRGLEENTIVILTSDHGDMLLSHGLQHKGKIWEESINVPFVARWPQTIPAGTVSDTLFSTVDIYPTLCGLCDVPVPPGKDGVDYSHVFLQREGAARETVFLTHDGDNKWRGLRTQRYTYRWDLELGRANYLFDNQSDPYQMNNLINTDSVAKIQQRLHDQLVQYLYEVSDPVATEVEQNYG